MARKTYYSYSRLWKYLRDPAEYYRGYVLGMWDPPTDKMVLGSIFAEAFADPKFPLEKALIAPQKFIRGCPAGISFTPNYRRVIEGVLANESFLTCAPEEAEQAIYVEGPLCPLMGKFDGKRESIDLLIENKFGTPWTEERAHTDDQVAFYSYIYWLKFNKIPKVLLQTVDRESGRIKKYLVEKTEKDFDPLKEKIELAYNGIQAKDWTHKETPYGQYF